MREILFRGKRIDDGEWVYGYLAAYDLISTEYPEDVSDAMGKYYDEIPYVGFVEVDPKTVGQFTGLTAKGKKIFEGDLCLCNRNINSGVDKQVFHINFDTEYGQWVGNSRSSNITADEFNLCEIVGNTHDNPELLED